MKIFRREVIEVLISVNMKIDEVDVIKELYNIKEVSVIMNVDYFLSDMVEDSKDLRHDYYLSNEDKIIKKSIRTWRG